MRRYFSRMHKEKGSGRTLGLDPFFRDGLCLFYLLLTFYFRILILHATDFNPRVNKDIIILQKQAYPSSNVNYLLVQAM